MLHTPHTHSRSHALTPTSPSVCPEHRRPISTCPQPRSNLQCPQEASGSQGIHVSPHTAPRPQPPSHPITFPAPSEQMGICEVPQRLLLFPPPAVKAPLPETHPCAVTSPGVLGTPPTPKTPASGTLANSTLIPGKATSTWTGLHAPPAQPAGLALPASLPAGPQTASSQVPPLLPAPSLRLAPSGARDHVPVIPSLLCVLATLLSQWGHTVGRLGRGTESRKAQRRGHEKGLECVCVCGVRMHTCHVAPGVWGTRVRTEFSWVLATTCRLI